MKLAAIKLVVTLCLGGPACAFPHPRFFATWDACARAGASMVTTARRVGTGDVGFMCIAEAGSRRE